MLLRKFFILVSCAFLVICMPAFAQIKEVIKVSGTFSDLNTAVEKKDAAETIKYLTISTQDYFKQVIAKFKQ